MLLLFSFNIQLEQTQEKRPRESILRTEFANAIDYINKDLTEDNRLRFLHWDLHKHSRRYVWLRVLWCFFHKNMMFKFHVFLLKCSFPPFLFQPSYRCLASSWQGGCLCVDTNKFLLLSSITIFEKWLFY